MENFSNEEKIAVIIGRLFGAYGTATDVDRQLIYTETLSEFPADVVKVACDKLLLENKFLPSIAEVVAAIESLLGTADENQRIRTWDEAWGEIEREMKRTAGNGYKPHFSRPEIERAAYNFGWNALCCSLAKDMPTVRAQVRRMYEDACKGCKEQSHNKYLLEKKGNGCIGYIDKLHDGGLLPIGKVMKEVKA